MMILEGVWHPPPIDLVLSSYDVHVWRASLNQPAWLVQQLAQTLSEDEQIRASRFYFEQHQQRFITGRGLLREILGRYLNIQPDQVQFCYGCYGKPALTKCCTNQRLNFNLSHSHEMALYAVTNDREIGIDLEQIRPMADIDQLAGCCFSAQEYAVFLTLPPAQKQIAFFNCWTRKEAYMKAVGQGLSLPLQEIEVSLAPGEAAVLLKTPAELSRKQQWLLRELNPGHGYVGAVVVEGEDWQLKNWQM